MGDVMVLEVAILDVEPGREPDFERAFGQAQRLLTETPGYVSHQLQRCIERSSRYILLVRWENLEAHTVGFRRSRSYEEWRGLLHHFYDLFPEVEHYEEVYGNAGSS